MLFLKLNMWTLGRNLDPIHILIGPNKVKTCKVKGEGLLHSYSQNLAHFSYKPVFYPGQSPLLSFPLPVLPLDLLSIPKLPFIVTATFEFFRQPNPPHLRFKNLLKAHHFPFLLGCLRLNVPQKQRKVQSLSSPLLFDALLKLNLEEMAANNEAQLSDESSIQKSTEFPQGEEDEEFYEEIEAPKFVDFTVPDHYCPDDRYWFCLRVGQ